MWAMFSMDMQKEVDEYNTFKKVFIRVVVLTLGLGLIVSVLTCGVIDQLLVEHRDHYLLIFTGAALSFVYVGVLIASFVFGGMYNHTRKIILEVSSPHPRWEWLAREYNESDMRALYATVKRLHDAVSEQSRMHGIAEIAARVAHDLRSPLAALSMAIDGVKNIPEAHYRLIQNSSRRISDIANDLLTTHRVESTKSDDQRTVKIAELFSSLIEEKIIQHQKAGVEFKAKFHHMTDYVVLSVSQTEFISMMSNLIDNAVEAMPDQLDKYVFVGTELNDDTLEIIVSDNGVGFSPKHLEEIKGGKYSTKKKNGNGLGLKNAMTYVKDKWKGEFDIHSTLGLGTEIKLKLKVGYN